jgi:hypothetical protein
VSSLSTMTVPKIRGEGWVSVSAIARYQPHGAAAARSTNRWGANRVTAPFTPTAITAKNSPIARRPAAERRNASATNAR